MSAPEPVRHARRLSKERLRTLVRELVFDGGSLPAWHERAACAGMDETLFFPLGEGGPAGVERIAQAKAVCAGCPVRSACLADAMTRESPSARYGVFGGLTATERGRLYVQLRDHARHLDALTAAEAEPDSSGAVA
ncbi:WhiB family transcriptional regulator [Actinomycetospora sp. OC33-EN08]|uniref:WhiB family transcriptional regulator n=1 Tax=Actinomycetospora aurantiaca TaxID=3129233 RepID=A0ABU8MWT2_9PSEU